MRYVVAWLTLILIPFRSVQGQEIITTISAGVAANLLVGQNVSVSNASFIGNGLQLARLNNGAGTLGIDEAVALTTGNAAFAATDNDYTVSGQSNNLQDDGLNDPDMDLLNGPGTVKNLAVLEFDFVTTDVGILFDYVFASKEYTEYIGSIYNDAFGFFISGPGISGPYSNGAVNIALIDGSPVSVNTIHPYDVNTHPELYVDTWNNIPDCAYDGRTVPIQAVLPVQCNVSYHAKLAICNTSDEVFHSGVFIRSHTLTSPYGPPPGPLTIAPVPQCEGQPLNLSVGGDPGWTYTWSTGQSGVGLQQISTTADIGTTGYSVSAEYIRGCSLSATSLPGQVVVHAANNTPPLCLGINGTGSYQAYVQAGDQLCFQIPTSDTPNEGVAVVWDGGAPGSFSENGAFQAAGTYCWSPTLADVGTYSFTMLAVDQNACGADSSSCSFAIKVVCDFCPISVLYENRSPGGLPLPALTEAGWRIVAGTDVDPGQTNGPVETGDAVVEFRAPEIMLEPGFVAGPNFVAIPDPESCLDECEACCDTWTGFTVDAYDPDGDGTYELNNWFEPDGDGSRNDHWQVHDADHPYCAYGATAYELTIIPAASGWGNPVYYTHQQPGGCCPFESRAPNHQIPYSSIHWDGTINAGNWNCQGCMVTLDAYYAYILTLYGCNGQLTYTGLIWAEDDALYGMLAEPGRTAVDDARGDHPEVPTGWAQVVPTEKEQVSGLWPNPARDVVTIEHSGGIARLNVYDMLGRQVFDAPSSTAVSMKISVSSWTTGDYVFRITSVSGTMHHHRFTKY